MAKKWQMTDARNRPLEFDLSIYSLWSRNIVFLQKIFYIDIVIQR